MTVTDPSEALQRLKDFVLAYVDGEIPDLEQMVYLRVDFCHNFEVGSALPDYVHTLSKVSFLKHRRTTDESGGVEWWNDNGRRVRVYDKYKEILEHDKKAVPQARGTLRFEIQIRKKSGFLQRRQKNKDLKLQHVLKPEIAYGLLVETLDKMSLAVDFQARDGVRNILDENFSFRTFDEFGKRYMDHAKANKRSWLRDEQMYRNLKEFFGSERQLTDFNPADIEGYKLHRKKEVSGSTVNRELALLKRMFNLAIDWKLFRDHNPVRKVRFFRELNTGTRVVSPEEEKKLLLNAAPYLQDMIRFDLNTGLRIGEVFTLRWSNVDFERSILNVFAPKTLKTRVVPINSDARRVLEAWALGRKNEFVFYNLETGKPFVDLKAGFAKACRKAGITGVTWKTLRHTFASRLVNRGVDIVTVQQLLGHFSVTVTMRYTHTNLDSKHTAVARLEGRSDSLHQNAAIERRTVTKRRYKLQCFSGLATERWQSG